MLPLNSLNKPSHIVYERNTGEFLLQSKIYESYDRMFLNLFHFYCFLFYVQNKFIHKILYSIDLRLEFKEYLIELF